MINEVKLKPGWLADDVRRATERAREWSSNQPSSRERSDDNSKREVKKPERLTA